VSVADEVVVINADGRFDDQIRRRNLAQTSCWT
jgi:hypothetical protein